MPHATTSEEVSLETKVEVSCSLNKLLALSVNIILSFLREKVSQICLSIYRLLEAQSDSLNLCWL